MLSRLRSPPLSVFFTGAADHAVAPFAQTEFDQLALEAPSAIAAGKVRGTNGGGEFQIFVDGQVFIEGVVLRDVADVALELVEVRVERLAVEQDLAAGRLELAGEHPQQRALAATARAHHANQLAAVDDERDAVERRDRRCRSDG